MLWLLQKNCLCRNLLIIPWCEALLSQALDDDNEGVEISDSSNWSVKRIELLKESLEEYRTKVLEPGYSSNTIVSECWSTLSEQILLSCPYLSSIEDLLHATTHVNLLLLLDKEGKSHYCVINQLVNCCFVEMESKIDNFTIANTAVRLNIY